MTTEQSDRGVYLVQCNNLCECDCDICGQGLCLRCKFLCHGMCEEDACYRVRFGVKYYEVL